ncbi:hypothetical protein BDB01DRAFT_372951 [Pilobolus umbonatus]|nr:hypothetical protein BDB01DRAFT_372951 [Pilobolus umbonatus]
MSESRFNVKSPPSVPTRGSTLLNSSMMKSTNNMSMFQSNNRKPVTRSRQNTIGMDWTGDDHVRNLGSDYQEIQIRTLTKWVNAQLKETNDSITNLKTDLRDGKKLLNLLSVLSKEPAPKHERMNMRIHQLANVAQALSFLEKQVGSENMPDIGNEAIVNGDAKKTIALIFFIMLKYQIQLIVTEHGEDFINSLIKLSERENGVVANISDINLSNLKPTNPIPPSNKKHNLQSIADKSHTSNSAEAKVALLYWVRIQLDDYISSNLIPSIQDFSRSWRNGVAFCLLIHRHNPIYIPDLFNVHLNADLSEKATWLHLLKLAFDIATTQMGIQSYLEPEDLVDVEFPHEPSVMMYVSEYYKVMSKNQNEESVSMKKERQVKRKAAILIATGGTALPDDEDEIPECESPPSLEELVEPIEHKEPIPVPMPSTRRKKKMAQRESTLGEEDKVRIKADLNSKLLMQLTGHLPRGVHPILDELLMIHETLLSYIKMNTKTIDEIPEEFISSLYVTEYIDALEILEEQMQDEERHLVTAKKARDILTSPPETADDTLIRLTDLQRTHVIKLYDMMHKEWDQLVDLLKVTKDDLISIERVLISTEERTGDYLERATEIEKEINCFLSLLTSVPPTQLTEEEEEKPLHPLDGSIEDSDIYRKQLGDLIEDITHFNSSTWKAFQDETKQLPRSVMTAVTARSDLVMKQHEELMNSVEAERKKCADFRRGLVIMDKLQEVETELENIQSIMGNNEKKVTTSDDIQVLESKAAGVRTSIFNIREEYDDLLKNDDRIKALFDTAHQRYEIVKDWVDQVRVWFIEAERIRTWIEKRIEMIDNQRNSTHIDPIGIETPWTDPSVDIHALFEEHKSLKREIERFNEDDMDRLRSHVKSLTSFVDHSLTPADTSTIEITLSTLNILNRLMSLLHFRSKTMDTLERRIQWEDLIRQCIDWIYGKDEELTEFIYGDARWSDRDVSDANNSRKQFTEAMIETLVQLENSIAQFDKGDFTSLLDKYQEMEEMHEETLPKHLEERQESLEKQFALLMKRCAFSRKIVEQHLVIMDVLSQFKRLKNEGEKLKSAMTHGNKASASSDNTDSSTFDNQIQQFKDNSSYWVTTLLKKIPYPELTAVFHNSNNDKIANDNANNYISNKMNDHSMYLAELTEDLEQLLSTYRNTLSLQQRAGLAYDDLLRLTSWLEEKIRALQKFDSQLLYQEETVQLEDGFIDRLEREYDGISTRLSQLQERDIKKCLETVHSLEVEIDSTNSLSIDRNTLVNGIDGLEGCLVQIRSILVKREAEIVTLKQRISWEAQVDVADQRLNEVAHSLWTFNSKVAQYDVEGLKNATQKPEPVDEEKHKEQHHQLSVEVNELGFELDIFASDMAFSALEQSYLEGEGGSVPEHIMDKQNDIKQKFEDIQHLFNYVTSVLDQYKSLTSFVELYDTIQSEGNILQDDIHSILRDSDHLVNSADVLKINTHMDSLNTQMQQFYQTGESIHALPYNHWFESCQAQPMVDPIEYNNQITSWVSKKIDNINKLEDILSQLFNTFQQMDDAQMKLASLVSEYEQLQIWIDQMTTRLNQSAINVASATNTFIYEQMIDTCQLEHKDFLQDVDEFESTRLSPFMQKKEELLSEAQGNVSSRSDEIREKVRLISDNLMRGAFLIKQTLSNQALVIRVAEERLAWDIELEKGKELIESLNHQLQLYISKKNKCVAQQDSLSLESVQELSTDRVHIADQINEFKSSLLVSIENGYTSVESMYLKLPLTKCVPNHLQEPMDLFKRQLKKLDDALLWREKELEFITHRCELESDVKEAFQDLDGFRKSISQFTDSKARWNPDNVDSDKEAPIVIKEIRKIWLAEKEAFEDFQSSFLASIREKYTILERASSSMKPGFMTEIHAKKIETLGQIEEYVLSDLSFAKVVIDQQMNISLFLDKSNQLEQFAEVIREAFLAKTPIEQMPDHNSALEKFSQKIEDIKSFVTTHIQYPKRQNEEEVSIPTKVKDKTMNSVVQDTVSTKLDRLDELYDSLSTLLKSQEVLTRLQYILQTFNKQAAACESWIGSRREMLENSVHLLEDDHLALDIAHLRDAVSEADSIKTAMKAHDNNYTLLKKYKDKYIEIFDEQILLTEEEKDDKMDEYDQVAESYEIIKHQWEGLLLETSEVSRALSNALIPAEMNGRIGQLMANFEILQNDITSVEESTVTDNHISDWQKRIDHLTSKEYDRLHTEIVEYKSTMSVEILESLKTKLEEAGETILTIRTTLSRLYEVIDASRLRNTHAENSELLKDAAMKIKLQIAEVKSNFNTIIDKETQDERIQHFKNLQIAQRQVKENILDCQGYYDDSCSYYSTILVQGATTEDCEKVQDDVEATWLDIQSLSSALSAFVNRTSKWSEACDELDTLQSELEMVAADISRAMYSPKPNSSTTTNNKIMKFDKQLSEIGIRQDELENNIKNAADMSEDLDNKTLFVDYSNGIRNYIASLQEILDKQKLEKERGVLIRTFQAEISKIAKLCEDQIAYIRQQSTANPEHHLKKTDSIKNVVSAYSAALTHIQDTCNESKGKYNGIISDQATKLVKTFQLPQSQIDSQVSGLDKVLRELNATIAVENDYLTSLRLLIQLIRFDKEITRSLSDLKSSSSRTYTKSTSPTKNNRARDLPELKEFMQKYKSLEESISEFYVKCEELKKNINRRIGSVRTTSVVKTVDKRSEEMKKKWSEVKSSADDTRDRLDMLHKRQVVASKLNESFRYVEDLKDRIEALHLSGKSISVEEQELDELQEEIDVTLKKNLKEIDVLLRSISVSETISYTAEVSLKPQRDKLTKAIDELRQLVKERLKQAHTEGSITEFFAMIDQVDLEISSLSKVIDETSTQYASVEGSKFNKSDLQLLYKKLATKFRKTEPKVTELLAKAKSEAQKQFLDDNDRVTGRLKKTVKSWYNIQASVNAREKELQICIKELNHEFFTKLAMAKSAPREKRRTNKPKSSSGSPRQSTFRSSTLSTEMKMTPPNSTSRRSKTPLENASRRNTKYVADPKNELDVQLGQIINDSPFRMQVKMVPGEVGKYWFGEEHPRLVYCRILPSKMVMVRVGGGWEELSKYMKGNNT